MDIEKEQRKELIAALGGYFTCYEEVRLQPAIFPRRTLKCDVLAIPTHPQLANAALAFEVKRPEAKAMLDATYWTRAIKQAADYLYATVLPHPSIERLAGRCVTAAVIYPGPAELADGIGQDTESQVLVGAFEVANHFRVGRASWKSSGNKPRGYLSIHMGRPLWRSTTGFKEAAITQLCGKRPFGTQQVDLLADLPSAISTTPSP